MSEVALVFYACQGVGIGKERAARALATESLFRAIRVLNSIPHSSARDAIAAARMVLAFGLRAIVKPGGPPDAA